MECLARLIRGWLSFLSSFHDLSPQTSPPRDLLPFAQDPLIPIGCAATFCCLTAGLYAFKSGQVRS